MFQKKIPALFMGLAAVNLDEGAAFQGTVDIDGISEGLLACAVLPGDEHRRPAAAGLGKRSPIVPDDAADIEDAAAKGLLRLRAGGGGNAGLIGRERAFAAGEEIGGAGWAAPDKGICDLGKHSGRNHAESSCRGLFLVLPDVLSDTANVKWSSPESLFSRMRLF